MIRDDWNKIVRETFHSSQGITHKSFDHQVMAFYEAYLHNHKSSSCFALSQALMTQSSATAQPLLLYALIVKQASVLWRPSLYGLESKILSSYWLY